MNITPTTVLASETRLLRSSLTGRDYRITISLPLGYAKQPNERWPFNHTPAQWPVIYVLDGNWYANLVTETIRPMAWCGSTSDAIVVGIGYPEGDDAIDAFRTSFTRRNADLTPVRDAAEEAAMARAHQRPALMGDAHNFLRFIQHELVPLVEQDFRADPAQRILLGHSYGGLFGLLALLEAPGLIATLILGSPTLSVGDHYIMQREAAFAQANRALPAQVYLFAAELEEALDDTTLTDTLRLAAILQARNYSGFHLAKRVFADLNHCEVAAPGFHWGLMHALKV